jgi:hypothetical protein
MTTLMDTLVRQRRWNEAEELGVQGIELGKSILGGPSNQFEV